MRVDHFGERGPFTQERLMRDTYQDPALLSSGICVRPLRQEPVPDENVDINPGCVIEQAVVGVEPTGVSTFVNSDQLQQTSEHVGGAPPSSADCLTERGVGLTD
jgi:hypothetical protein